MGTRIKLGIGIPNTRKKQNTIPPIVYGGITVNVFFYEGVWGESRKIGLTGVDIIAKSKETGIETPIGKTNAAGEVRSQLPVGEYSVRTDNNPPISGTVNAEISEGTTIIYNMNVWVSQSIALDIVDWFGKPMDDLVKVTCNFIQGIRYDLPEDLPIKIPVPYSSEQYLSIDHLNRFYWENFQETVSVGPRGELAYPGGTNPIRMNPRFFNKIIFEFTRETGNPIESGKIVLKEVNHPDWVEELILVNGKGEIQLPSYWIQNTFVYNWAFSYEGTETFSGTVNLIEEDISVVEMIRDVVIEGITLTDVSGAAFSIFQGPYDESIPLTVDWGDGDVEVIAPYTEVRHSFKTGGNHTIKISEPADNVETLRLNHKTSADIEDMVIKKFGKIQTFDLFRLQAPGLDVSSLVGSTYLKFNNCPNLNKVDFQNNTKLMAVDIYNCPLFVDFSFINNPSFHIFKFRSVYGPKTFVYDYSTTFPTLQNLDLSRVYDLETLTLNKYSYMEILSLEGCESLTDLQITDSSLVKFTGLDSLTALKKLWIYRGSHSLKLVDLTGNPNLTDVRLYNMPDLTTINLNENVAIGDFRIRNNPKLITITGLPKKGGGYFEIIGGSCPSKFEWSPESLGSLYINNTSSLKEISITESGIEELNLDGCSELIKVDCLNTTALKLLTLTGCLMLETVNLGGSPIVQLPAEIQKIVGDLPVRTSESRGSLIILDVTVADTIREACEAKFWDVL